MATCRHQSGCFCDNFREELNGPHIVTNGNCLNCSHPVNLHPRRPAETPISNTGIAAIKELKEEIKESKEEIKQSKEGIKKSIEGLKQIQESVEKIKRQRLDHNSNRVLSITEGALQVHVESTGGLTIEEFVPSAGSPIFETQFSSSLNEHELIALGTVDLNQLAKSSGYDVFVNSEEYKWIRSLHLQHHSSQHDYKPDGLFSLEALYYRKLPSGSANIKDYRRETCKGTDFSFGRGVWEIKDMYGPVFEAKTKMTYADRGRVYGYLQHLSYDDKLHTYRVVLMDREQFLTVECKNAVCFKAVLGNITDSGSLEYLTQFLSHKSRWLRLLEGLCKELEVELFRPEGMNSAFLGAGLCGRCFSVREKSGQQRILALKCVLLHGADPRYAMLVNAEFDKMASYGFASVPNVMRVCPGSLKALTETSAAGCYKLGAGYLMMSVGRPLPATEEYHIAAVRSLAGFHTHDPPLYHGDARAPNVVVLSDDSLSWIDWMLCAPGIGSPYEDLKKFIESTRGKNVWVRVSRAQTLLDEYGLASASALTSADGCRDAATIATELVKTLFKDDKDGLCFVPVDSTSELD